MQEKKREVLSKLEIQFISLAPFMFTSHHHRRHPTPRVLSCPFLPIFIFFAFYMDPSYTQ
jgi:hypothetical protein